MKSWRILMKSRRILMKSRRLFAKRSGLFIYRKYRHTKSKKAWLKNQAYLFLLFTDKQPGIFVAFVFPEILHKRLSRFPLGETIGVDSVLLAVQHHI